MKQKRVIPAFQPEGEEAEWWYKNRVQLDKDLVSRSRPRAVSIRLPMDDIELARRQAAQRGLPYRTYIKSVLHQTRCQAK